MSSTPHSEIEPSYRILSTVVKPQPDEHAFPLTRDKYDLLRRGDVSEERQSRDVCIAVFGSSLIGIITMLPNLDWDKGRSYAWMFPMALMCLGSAALWIFFAIKMKSQRKDQGCVRIMKEIDSHFILPESRALQPIPPDRSK
jgi:hypothetical protein